MHDEARMCLCPHCTALHCTALHCLSSPLLGRLPVPALLRPRLTEAPLHFECSGLLRLGVRVRVRVRIAVSRIDKSSGVSLSVDGRRWVGSEEVRRKKQLS